MLRHNVIALPTAFLAGVQSIQAYAQQQLHQPRFAHSSQDSMAVNLRWTAARCNSATDSHAASVRASGHVKIIQFVPFTRMLHVQCVHLADDCYGVYAWQQRSSAEQRPELDSPTPELCLCRSVSLLDLIFRPSAKHRVVKGFASSRRPMLEVFVEPQAVRAATTTHADTPSTCTQQHRALEYEETKIMYMYAKMKFNSSSGRSMGHRIILNFETDQRIGTGSLFYTSSI